MLGSEVKDLTGDQTGQIKAHTVQSGTVGYRKIKGLQSWDRSLVISLNSRYLGQGKEELLFEDADGFWLLRFANSEIVRSDFFYKPGSFGVSRCEILADYLVCASRMKVAATAGSSELLWRNYLFVWKKQKVSENSHHGFTYRIIRLFDSINPRWAIVVESYEKNCISFLDP